MAAALVLSHSTGYSSSTARSYALRRRRVGVYSGTVSQLLDRDGLVFDGSIKRLRIARPQGAHTLHMCGIEPALGGANRLSAGGEIHCWGRIACAREGRPVFGRAWQVSALVCCWWSSNLRSPAATLRSQGRFRWFRARGSDGPFMGAQATMPAKHRERATALARDFSATLTSTELAAHSGQGDFIGCLQRNSLYRAEIGTGCAGGACAPGPSIALWGTLHYAIYRGFYSSRTLRRLIAPSHERHWLQRPIGRPRNGTRDTWNMADLNVIIRCPTCGHRASEEMPLDRCVFVYECLGCHTVLTPKQGECCVYCSYGDRRCPFVQDDQPCP